MILRCVQHQKCLMVCYLELYLKLKIFLLLVIQAYRIPLNIYIKIMKK